jgi:hypothetical protein
MGQCRQKRRHINQTTNLLSVNEAFALSLGDFTTVKASIGVTKGATSCLGGVCGHIASVMGRKKLPKYRPISVQGGAL